MKKLYFDSDAGWSTESDGDEFFTGNDFFSNSPALNPDNPSDPSANVKLVDDTTSSTGKSLRVEPGAANAEIVRLKLEWIPFGLYSVIVRSKSSVNSGSTEVYKIIAYSGDTQLTSYAVKENDYTQANNWESLGIGINFKGTTGDPLVIVLKRDTYAGQSVIDFDYVKVSPAPVAINAIT